MPQVSQITIRKGVTINVGEFQNARYEVEVTMEKTQPEETFAELYSHASSAAHSALMDEIESTLNFIPAYLKRDWLTHLDPGQLEREEEKQRAEIEAEALAELHRQQAAIDEQIKARKKDFESRLMSNEGRWDPNPTLVDGTFKADFDEPSF